ncbi:hypothetical protein IC582_006238 [Cucumis melo]|uniref:FLZ-type domain-containing protein n=1 Tax=Cucumis melo TaxID=3656 RepID=A0A9I9D0F9_CUCME
MLRKRTRSVQKDQYRMNQMNVPCSGSELHTKCSSIFKRSHLFTGLSPKGLESDSAKSPTSPLDFWVLSSLGNPLRSPRSSSNEGHRKNWDSSKVGLSIIDSLNDDDSKLFGKVLRSSDSKTALFGPRSVAKKSNCPPQANLIQGPKSLPKNYPIFQVPKTKTPIEQGNSDVIFEIGETPLEYEPFGNYSRSFDSYRGFAPRAVINGLSVSSCSTTTESVASPCLGEEPRVSEKYPLTKPCSISLGLSCDNGSNKPLSASDIELSEDYTCVISHGPNPKTTHIYGDCILECHSNYLSSSSENEMKEVGFPHPLKSLNTPTSYSLTDFLSMCYSCHKKLDEGKDIYIYRGEKAFCSLTCRSQEMLMDEELEKSIDKTSESSPKSSADHDEDLFETSIGGFA